MRRAEHLSVVPTALARDEPKQVGLGGNHLEIVSGAAILLEGKVGAELREQRRNERGGDLEPAIVDPQDCRWGRSTRCERRGGGSASGGITVGGGRRIAGDAKGLGGEIGRILGTLGHETRG